jgi:hypothetical protein
VELPAKYPLSHYERKADRYAHAVRAVFGVEVDQTTRERWRDVIGLARGIDTYLDEGDRDTLHVRTVEVMSALAQPDFLTERFPAISLERLGPNGYRHLCGRIYDIMTLNQVIKTTDSLSLYAQLRRVEGKLYAGLITSVATPVIAVQPGYHRFCRWLRVAGDVTNLGNSYRDIWSDYDRGEIALQPCHTSRVRLVGHMAVALMQARETSRQSTRLGTTQVSAQLYNENF